MWLKTVYLCPFCKGECDRHPDRLVGRGVVRCGACKRMVSRSACACEKKAVWDAGD